MTPEPRSPSPVDVYVGARLRMRRKLLGISQEQLAGRLGLTFQQVQKYERGTNRVSASKLHAAAQALQVSVTFFFDGLADPLAEDTTVTTGMQQMTALLRTSEGTELVKYFSQIATASDRRRILDLIHAIADEEPDAGAV